MKYFLSLFFFFLFYNASSQKQLDSTLEVVGFGRVQAQPDIGIIEVEISTIQMDFNKSIDSLTILENQVIALFKSLDYQEEQLKTNNYSVSTNTRWKSGTSYDSGYVASQSLVLEFSNDKSEIAKLINGFSNSDIDAHINFKFKLSNKKRATIKKQVIQNAIDDANSSAKIIANGSGKSLGDIIEIKYGNVPDQSWFLSDDLTLYQKIPITEQPRSISTGFSVQQITYTDKVLIIYQLK